MSVNIKKILERYDQIEDKVLKQLQDIGVSTDAPKMSIPEGIKDIIILRGKDPFVGDLTSASNPQIGMLMSFFGAHTLYIHGQAERFSRVKKIRKEKLDRLKTALKVYLKKELKVKSTDLVMEMETYRMGEDDDLPVFVQANASLVEVELLHSAVEQRHKDLRTVLNIISREQSRRDSEFKTNNRVESVNSKKSENYTNRSSWSGGDSRW